MKLLKQQVWKLHLMGTYLHQIEIGVISAVSLKQGSVSGLSDDGDPRGLMDWVSGGLPSRSLHY